MPHGTLDPAPARASNNGTCASETRSNPHNSSPKYPTLSKAISAAKSPKRAQPYNNAKPSSLRKKMPNNLAPQPPTKSTQHAQPRSEERRVGKEGIARGARSR